MKKFSFLSLFFLALGVAFVGAVTFRIHSHSTSDPTSKALRSGTNGDGDAVDSIVPGSSSNGGGGELAGNSAVANGTGANGQSTGSTGIANSREQRFNEVLRQSYAARPPSGAPVAVTSAPPPRPTPPPQPKPAPSLLSRMANAVSNAFTGSSNASQTSHTGALNKDGGTGNQNASGKDPSSDTTPPQLLGIEFIPPSIHDGEETVIAVTATDDLSGIRNISGSVTSPTGKALQGFALQNEAGSNRYVGRVAVPKDAEEGVWHINFLSLTDNASNTSNLNYSQGTLPATASFRVQSSRPDSTPPTLRNVWVDKRAMNGGDHDTIFIQADDDKSGVNLVSGVFQSPKQNARIGFGCRLGDSGNWECDFAPPKSVDCGDWQLEQVQMQDKANNMGTARYTDNPLVAGVKVTISSDSCDSTPPQLHALVLDPPVVSNVQDSLINASANVSDDLSGVANLSGQAQGPPVPGGQPARIYFSFSPSPNDSQTFIGQIRVPKLAAKGIWSVVWIQVIDKANNIKQYSASDPALANAKFQVR